MKLKLWPAIAMSVVSIALIGEANAAINLTATYQLQLVGGPDTPGLSGATVTMAAEFTTGATYINRFGFPELDSVSDTFTISGATVGSSNGVFSTTSGSLGFYPTFTGQLFNGGPLNGLATWNLPGGQLSLGNLLNSVGGVSIGDIISTSHFGTTLTSNSQHLTFSDGSAYRAVNLNVQVSESSSVPEPATLTMFGAGMMAFGLISHLRRKFAR